MVSDRKAAQRIFYLTAEFCSDIVGSEMKTQLRPFLVGLLVVIVIGACLVTASHALAPDGTNCDQVTADLTGKALSFATVTLPPAWEAWFDLVIVSYLLVSWDPLEHPSNQFFSTLPTRSPPIE